MKAYRIVTYVVDFENLGQNEVVMELLCSDHLGTTVGKVDEIDIGEWDDDHPLNHRDTDVEAYFQKRIK